MKVNFYKRFDGSSIDIVGAELFNLLSNSFDIKLYGSNDGPVVDRPAEIGIVCGLFRDLHWLKRHSKRIAALVCETDLTKQEIEILSSTCIDQIWVPSKFCAEKFMKAGFYNVRVVPHGIGNVKVSYDYSIKNKVLMIFNSYSNRNFHVERKGIFETLEAFRFLDKKLILRTAKRSYYNNLVGNNIQFIEGRLSDSALNCLYEDADIVLCPSHSEGFGLIGLEALCRGIPLISTKTGNGYLSNDISYIHLELPIVASDIKSSIELVYGNFDKFKEKAILQSSHIWNSNRWEIYKDLVVTNIKELVRH